jgi:hypothetical protein
MAKAIGIVGGKLTELAGPRVAFGETNTSIGLTADHYFIAVDASAAARVVSLPSAASAGAGRSYKIKKTDGSTNGVTVECELGDSIDGASSIEIEFSGPALTLISNGVDTWYVD